MDREEMIKELMENEGLSKDEAEERLVQYEEEEEHLGYLRFMELHNENR
ncbi:MAG: hypothetical protein IIZ80_06655 [Erysipelotrichaceae bacterium]|nr:hypothetical protein [Erysipelotrichaceae bacterium]